MPKIKSTRYSEPRELINWSKTEELKCLKMMSWVIWSHEKCPQWELWKRTNELCEGILLLALKTPGLTLDRIRKHTKWDQDMDITPNKLMQRADRTERYGEYNMYADAVRQAYLQIMGVGELDPRRFFSDKLVQEQVNKQGVSDSTAAESSQRIYQLLETTMSPIQRGAGRSGLIVLRCVVPVTKGRGS